MILPGVPFSASIQLTLPDGYGVRRSDEALFVIFLTFGSEDVVQRFPFHVRRPTLEETINDNMGKRLLHAAELRAIVGGDLGDGVRA